MPVCSLSWNPWLVQYYRALQITYLRAPSSLIPAPLHHSHVVAGTRLSWFFSFTTDWNSRCDVTFHFFMKRRNLQVGKKVRLMCFRGENKIWSRFMSWVIDTKSSHDLVGVVFLLPPHVDSCIITLGSDGFSLFWKKKQLLKHNKTILNSLKLLFLFVFWWTCFTDWMWCAVTICICRLPVVACKPSILHRKPGGLQTDTMLLFYHALSTSHLSWSNIRKHQAVVEHTESIFITKCKCHVMQMLSSSSPWSSSPQDEAVNVTFIAQEASTVFSGMAHRAHNEPFKGFCL